MPRLLPCLVNVVTYAKVQGSGIQREMSDIIHDDASDGNGEPVPRQHWRLGAVLH